MEELADPVFLLFALVAPAGGLEVICEKGRHQNCIHTRLKEKRAGK